MTLAYQTLLLAICMALFSALPLLSARVRHHSRVLFLMGTGALFGICFFDLVPDVFELGGSQSLYVMGGVWLAYSLLHIFHLQHHDHDHDPAEGGKHEVAAHGFALFFGSLLAHCLASGMLLAISQGLSSKIAHTVLLALLAHKAYESLLLTSILIAQRRTTAWKVGMIALYSLSLPAGVIVTTALESSVTHSIAIWVSSIAVGTLLGCLIFDFMLPSIRQLRHGHHSRGSIGWQRVSWAGWTLLGLALTRLVMH